MTDVECIDHIIRGIDNFTIRIQLASAQHETLDGLFKTNRSISSSIGEQSRDNHRSWERQDDSSKRNYRDEDKHRGDQYFQWNKSEQGRGAEYKHSGPTVNSRALVCYKCDRPGHIARLCTATVSDVLKQNSSNQSVMHMEPVAVDDAEAYHKLIVTGNAKLIALLDSGCPLNLIKYKCLQFIGTVETYERLVILPGFGNSRYNALKQLRSGVRSTAMFTRLLPRLCRTTLWKLMFCSDAPCWILCHGGEKLVPSL